MYELGSHILAFDPASRTGLACGVPGGIPRLESLKFRRDPSDTPEDIFAAAYRFIDQELVGELPGLVVIEAPIPAGQMYGFTNFDTTRIALGLQGIFIGAAKARGVDVLMAPISAWRKFFLGSGKLKGVAAKARSVALCKQLGWSAPDHNAAEAAGIFAWACSQVDPIRAPRVEPLFSGLVA